MFKKAHNINNISPAIGPYSHVKQLDQWLFLSGQLPIKDGVLVNEIKEATKACLENIQTILTALNSDLDHVIKTTVFLKDMADFAAMNEVYSNYFTNEPPARSCLAVKQLPKDAILEIEVIAVVAN